MASANLLMAETFRKLLEAHYVLNQIWSTKGKYQLADLRTSHPKLARMADAYLNCEGSSLERFKLLETLVKDFVETHGGSLGDREWVTGMESHIYW